MGREDLAVAEESFQKAIELDPKSVVALSGLAVCSAWQVTFGWTDDLQGTSLRGIETAHRAIELDDQDAWALAALGFVKFLTGDHDEAKSACLGAIDLNPSMALAEGVLGSIYAWAGEYEEATSHANMAERLSPRDPAHGMWCLAHTTAEYQAGNYEAAALCARKMIEATPKYPAAWRYLAASYANLERIDEAKAAIDQLLRIHPNDSLKLAQTLVPGADQTRRQHYFDGLKKAGLPEN